MMSSIFTDVFPAVPQQEFRPFIVVVIVNSSSGRGEIRFVNTTTYPSTPSPSCCEVYIAVTFSSLILKGYGNIFLFWLIDKNL